MIVVGIALLMSLVGLSPALGTFIAGVVLANNEYRHELEANIEPFRGLLLFLGLRTFLRSPRHAVSSSARMEHALHQLDRVRGWALSHRLRCRSRRHVHQLSAGQVQGRGERVGHGVRAVP